MQYIGFPYAKTFLSTHNRDRERIGGQAMEVGQLHYSLRQLRYFVVTAEVLSFTAAARKLHISQPSISTAKAAWPSGSRPPR